MCGPGGKSNEPPGPASNPVTYELPERPRAEVPRPRTSTRPSTNSDRPRTSKSRPHTSENRPKSHRRPESKQRPESSSRPRTSEQGRRSSHRDHHHKERSRHDFPAIQEQEYTEDRAIFRRLDELATFIDQHVGTFYYPLKESGYSNDPDLDNPHTRHYALRRDIMWRVINYIIMAGRDSSPDTTTVAHTIANEFEAFANSSPGRIDHLKSLCKLGNKLRRDISNHPSDWEFDSQEDEGYIVMVPALLKDGNVVVANQVFRT